MKKATFLETVELKEAERRAKAPTAISLFTGCGGCALGFMQAGIEVRVMVEWSKDACKTLRANFTLEGRKRMHESHIAYFKKEGDEKAVRRLQRRGVYIPSYVRGKREPAILEADITKLSTKEILDAGELKVGEAMTLEGGFPCQGFSMAGARMINDPRNRLYKECVRVIREALPRTFMLENVPGLVSMDRGNIIVQIVTDLAACGYDVTWNILDAADYGVPQHRKRVFFIGTRIDAMVFPKKGNPKLCMGAAPGTRSFPSWFFERPWARKNKKIMSLLELSGVRPDSRAEDKYVVLPSP